MIRMMPVVTGVLILGFLAACGTRDEQTLLRRLGVEQLKTEEHDSGARPALALASARDVGGGMEKIRIRSAEWNTEQYEKRDENGFLAVTANPLSTFSIDVDTASYANARRFLQGGMLPPKDAVRLEEFVNYFSYDYQGPQDGHPFAVHAEVAACPWNDAHKLARIGVQGRRIDVAALPPSNLVFLVDVSGSMSAANKLPLVRSALKLLAKNLRAADRVAIVVYAGAAGLVLPSTAGDDRKTIEAALERLQAGGSTAGGAGIRLAYDVAGQYFMKNGNNRVILCTDGDFNVGASSDGEMVRLVEEKRASGVYLTVLGFGMGNYKDARMQKMADAGNGNYAYIDTLLEAQKVLVSQMGGTLVTIAKDVKIQVEFNPAAVKGYRLLGYEKRLLRAEDFNNDKKDAGELGAGHTVTALYELVPHEARTDLGSIDALKYQPATAGRTNGASGELMTVKLRYKKPDGDTSIPLAFPVANTVARLLALPGTDTTTADFRFASAVAEMALLLQDSAYKGKASWTGLIGRAEGATGKDAEGWRGEFVRLARIAQALSGK